MKNMISVESKGKIVSLGRRIRSLRLEKNEVQVRFAARLGVSVPTLRKMENGDETVALGTWVEAIRILGRLEDMDILLKKQKDLFEIRDAMISPQRYRASRRKG